MATENDSFFRTFIASGTLTRGMLVKMTTTAETVEAATTNDVVAIGVAQADAANADNILVKLWAPTQRILSNSAVAAGKIMYGLASGEVDDTGTTAMGLISINATAGAAELVECARTIGPNA